MSSVKNPPRPYCPTCDKYVEALVKPVGYEDAMIIDENGFPARWWDGTMGLTDEDYQAAMGEETAYCFECWNTPPLYGGITEVNWHP